MLLAPFFHTIRLTELNILTIVYQVLLFGFPKYVGTDVRIAWGFLASKEIKSAGSANAGLYDRKFTISSVYS